MSKNFEELKKQMSNNIKTKVKLRTKQIALVYKAIEFSKLKHKDQMYGDYPYTYHLNGVVDNVINDFVLSDELLIKCQIIGYLHDTLEDTDTTFDELKDLFGDDIASCVYWLTKPNEMFYHDYIMRLIEHGSIEAIIVKIADLKFNISQCQLIPFPTGAKKHRYEKYHLALKLIRQMVGKCYEKRKLL